jgi:hypothetical protein
MRGRFDTINKPFELHHLEITPPLDVAHAPLAGRGFERGDADEVVDERRLGTYLKYLASRITDSWRCRFAALGLGKAAPTLYVAIPT